jgi:hypothetical protein
MFSDHVIMYDPTKPATGKTSLNVKLLNPSWSKFLSTKENG